MTSLLRTLVPAMLLCAATAGAFASGPVGNDSEAAADPDACAPRVVEGWLRSPPMPMPMMAGFARIENPCATGVEIVSAHSDAFASVELHETRVVDGVSRMREVPRLAVAADGEAVLQPGGLHLMLMRPVAPLQSGGSARVEFTLADGRSIGADFEVRAANAR
ncbi:copper chaperone PCu(A)C [Luteimonas sp. MJ204]|uniref:copper chaperone PCu(A)C n=1 Tax=Luteimonas sp. MJ145 TaxID=3129234 RepID=UPI0031BACFCF